jgi:hypothetical protein
MRRITFALGAAALLSLGAITAPAHAEYGERYPHRVIVVPAPPPPPHAYYGYGQPPQRWHGGHDRRDHHHRGWRDNDRDGVPNRYDRDRDGDGVPNRYDRRPGNPYRY